MFSANNRISGRQTFRLLTYDLLGLGTLLVPTVLAKTAGRDGIFCIVIGVVAGLLYLKLLGGLVEDMGTSFPLYLEQKLGKFLGRALQVGYLIYLVLLAGYTAYLFADVVLTSLLREESFYLVLVIILLLAAYGLWGGIEGRARIYEMLFWFIMIPLFLMLFFALDEIQVDYWVPVFTADWKGILEGSYYVFLCLSLVFLVLFLGGYVEKKQGLVLAGKQALLFTGGVHGVLYLILLGIFGAKALGTMDYPAVTMMSTVKISGGFLKRTDAFMFAVWFFTLFALLNSCIFYSGNVLAHLAERIGGSVQQQKKERMASLVVLAAVLALACCFYRSREGLEVYRWFLWYVGTPFLVLVPLLLALWQFLSGKKFSSGKKWRSGAKRGIGMVVLALLSGGVLSGCHTAELEDRNFPIEIAVQNTKNFGEEWLDAESAGNRMIDYSHLKVMILSREFIEDEAAMDEFLNLLEEKNEVPRNTYLVVAEDAREIIELQDAIGESVGNYLEEQFENVSEVKKQAYPTIGMLYQEKENQSETLFIPYVVREDDKPVVKHYYAWKRGQAAGIVDNETALLSFFTGNNMDSHTITLRGGTIVSLSAPHNEVTFRENGKQREILVELHCSGEVVSPGVGADVAENSSDTRAELALLEQQLALSMNEKAQAALRELRIDVANSYRKLGGIRRDWYQEYQKYPGNYEEDMDIVYQVDIDWVNL